MDEFRSDYWSDVADRYGDAHLRDVQAGEDRRERARARTGFTLSETGPLARPLTEGWAMYGRMHPDESQVFILAPDGKGYWVTERQATVYHFVRDLAGPMTIRAMAQALGYAASTVSRAMVKLASFGIIAYLTGRGRYAGTVIIQRMKDDGLERFREAAKAKVRQWREAAQKRLSLVKINVALRYSWREIGSTAYADYYLPVYLSKSATLTAQPFTVEELRDAGII